MDTNKISNIFSHQKKVATGWGTPMLDINVSNAYHQLTEVLLEGYKFPVHG